MKFFLFLWAIGMLLAFCYNVVVLVMLAQKSCRSTTLARLEQAKGRQNVTVRKGGGDHRKVPHYSTGIYRYTVNGKDYTLRTQQCCAPGQLPKMPRVTYLTALPRHGYLEGDLGGMPEVLRGFLWLICGLMGLLALLSGFPAAAQWGLLILFTGCTFLAHLI